MFTTEHSITTRKMTFRGITYGQKPLHQEKKKKKEFQPTPIYSILIPQKVFLVHKRPLLGQKF